MKSLATAALALTLGACAHDCNCADVESVDVESVEIFETVAEEPEAEVVVEETVVEETVIETVVETPVLEIEPAPAATTTIVPTETGTARRVVTRRLVDEIEAGTPTAPAIDGSAADDALLSETPRVLEDSTFDTSSVPDTDSE